MSTRNIKVSRSKKKLFSGLSFKKSFKSKAEATPAPDDQQALHVHAVDAAGGAAAAAGEAPVPKQPFVVVSGMKSLSGDVPSTSPKGGSTARGGDADAPEMTTEDLVSAEVDTATKAPPDSPSSAARAVDFDQVQAEVLRVGVAGSRSLSGDDSAASVTDRGSTPAKAAGVPEPVRGDLAADVTSGTNDSVAKAPGTSSRRDNKKTEEGIPAAKEPSDEAKAKASSATKRTPAGKKRYVVVSGYAQDTSSDKTGVASAGRVGARPETKADGGGVGKDTDTPPSLEVKKPKKGLFRPVFGSKKSLSEHELHQDYVPDVRSSQPDSSKDEGFQPVSDTSVDTGDHTSDESTGTEARLKMPSGETNVPKRAPIGGGSSSSKMKSEAKEPSGQPQLPVLY